MKRFHSLKQKIIFYVMSVSILVAALIVIIMSVCSVVSTNKILLDNMQTTARIASQNISSNLHLLTERMYHLSGEPKFTDGMISIAKKQEEIENAKLQIEFVWLAAYDIAGQKLYGDEAAPFSIADTTYYSHLENTKNIVIGEPYYADGLLQLCVGVPLERDDMITGYLIGSYKYDLLNDVLSMLIMGNTGSACIVNEEGQIVGDRNFENIIEKKNIYEQYSSVGNRNIFDRVLENQTGAATVRFGLTKNYIGYAPISGTNWSLLIYAPQREFMGSVLLSVLLSVFFSVIILIAAAAVITPVSVRISSAVSAVTKRLQALAEGDLSEDVVLSDTIEETVILTNALSKTIESLNGYIETIRDCLGSLADGDYTVDIPDCFDGDFVSIRSSLCNIADALNRTMRQMNRSSVEITRNSGDVSDFARRLHDGSLNQEDVLRQLHGSMTAITASIEKNKEHVHRIERCSKDANEKTMLGDNYMRSMLETMSEIHSTVEEISKISQLIEEISSQTNLLSLNASIEAARAGEAGRGFAIVASEIGALSSQTSEALKETGNLIVRSSEIIEKGLETADQTAKAFHEIREVTKQYDEISVRLSESSEEQSAAVACVNEELDSLRSIANENRSLAEETDKMAAGSLSQSEELKEYVSQVKIKEG